MTDSVQEIAIAIVRDGEQYLVGSRRADQTLAGYTEFPGGKVHSGETPSDAAIRECLEEAGLQVTPVESLGVVEHEYDHGPQRLSFFLCEANYPTSVPIPPFQWIEQVDLTIEMFPPANAEVLRRLGFAEC